MNAQILNPSLIASVLRSYAAAFVHLHAIAKPGDIVQTPWAPEGKIVKAAIEVVGAQIVTTSGKPAFEMIYRARRLNADGTKSRRGHGQSVLLTALTTEDGRTWKETARSVEFDAMHWDIWLTPEDANVPAPTERLPLGEALIDGKGYVSEFRPRVRDYFGEAVEDDGYRFTHEDVAAADRSYGGAMAPHHVVRVFGERDQGSSSQESVTPPALVVPVTPVVVQEDKRPASTNDVSRTEGTNDNGGANGPEGAVASSTVVVNADTQAVNNDAGAEVLPPVTAGASEGTVTTPVLPEAATQPLVAADAPPVDLELKGSVQAPEPAFAGVDPEDDI